MPLFNQLEGTFLPFVSWILAIFFQSAKLLSDVSVIQFYPSKFVLVTDILDTFGKHLWTCLFERVLCVYILYNMWDFAIYPSCCLFWFVNLFAGRLVYDRLKEKAVYIPAGSGVARSLPGDLVKPYGKLSLCCNFLRWHKFKFKSTAYNFYDINGH